MSVETSVLTTLAAAGVVSLALDDAPPLRFAPSGIRKALAALSACERDLQVKWGFDMALADRVATPPVVLGGDTTRNT